MTRPVNAGEMCRIEIAGVKAATNQSETKAAPTPAASNNTAASHSGQEARAAGAVDSLGTPSGSPFKEIGMLATNTASKMTAQAILSPSSCPDAAVCKPCTSVG